MAHNQLQFQKIYKAHGMKLRRGTYCFAQVNYHPGKYVEIYLEEDMGMLTLEKRQGETEDDFVCRAVKAFNRKEFDA